MYLLNLLRLKNTFLCRVTLYTVVIAGLVIPIVLIAKLEHLSELAIAIVCMSYAILWTICIFKNFALLMTVDTALAMIHCNSTARKWFVLPKSFSVEKAERKISKFGKEYEPTISSPYPKTLRYKSNAPITIYSKGIEKIVITYHTEFLNKNEYHLIISSAKSNSQALKGKKEYRFLEKTQKKSLLNRATVIIIFAKSVDDKFRNELFDIVCKNGGDGFDTAWIPCIVDLEKEICTFDSLRIPYMGFQYPVKNRGLKIIYKYLFNNKLTLADSPDMLAQMEGLDPEQTLLEFWKTTKKEVFLDEKERKKRFESMKHREIILVDDYLYLKWFDNGVWVAVELNEEFKIAEIDDIDFWDYPKSNQISKGTIKEIKSIVNNYFAGLGYTTKYM